MKKVFFILLFFVSSCGYEPIYLNKKLENFEFQKITLKGDDYVNRKIVNTLLIKENKNSIIQSELLISNTAKTEGTSKNSKGQIKSFRTVISIYLEIKNNEKNTIQSRNFQKSFSYNNKKNKFELVEYQNFIKNDLINQIIKDIIIFINTQ